MSDKKVERRGLGRGLSALMADVAPAQPTGEGGSQPRRPDLVVPVEKIHPNPNQPRRQFATESLQDLAASIREKGVIQPLIVRANPTRSGEYEIVAGERRWRASQMAQLHEVPVLVREFSDTEVLEVAIIENIQRADLNPVEEAMGYRQLMDRHGHTQEKLAEGLGKSRSHIANVMRLLQLPDEVLGHVRAGTLSAGHARALITTRDPAALARKVLAEGLSVRQTEALARKEEDRQPQPRPRGSSGGGAVEKDADTRVLEQDLSANLGMTVVIDHRDAPFGGLLTIRYKTLEDLDELCRVLSTSPLRRD